MINPLPAVLIGGPPHAGKSVLFYGLTQALRARGIRHHAIRACPDGEGNWFQEGDPETVSRIRMPIRGEWPQAFVNRMCLDLEHRCLPFLVDMGGHPRESQACLLQQCTDSILLLRADREEYTRLWEHVVAEYHLSPLARVYSQQEGASIITAQSPFIEGTISGLERYNPSSAQGPLFEMLVDSVATLFQSHSGDREKIILEQAPTETVLNLYTSLRTFTSTSTSWRFEMLNPLLERLPSNTPLSVYGAGPNWLYAALAAHTDPQPFYQCDPRFSFGWTQPIALRISSEQFAEAAVETREYQDVTVLSVQFPYRHLEYFQPDPLPFPSVRPDAGLILNGPLPFWLVTALVRLYKEAGVAWIAPYYVPANKAVVAYSRVMGYVLGDTIPLPFSTP